MGTKSTSENANLARQGRVKSITPELHEQIRELWLQGKTLSEMEAATGIPRSTLQRFVATVLRPQANAAGVRHMGELLAEMQMLRAFAWEQLQAAGKPQQRITEKTIPTAAKAAGRSKKAAAALVVAFQRIVQTYPNQSARNWAQVIEWCIEQECRLAGYYRQPSGSPVGEFRVAGSTPDQINEKMLKRLRDCVMAVREQARIREQFTGHNNV